MLKRAYFLLFVFFIAGSVNGQYFETGQDPASIRWRQINTENFQLIYPEDFENQAQRMANVLERVYEVGGQSLNHKPRKISVILHTQTVKSNGLVAIAPWRVELFTTPHQSIYPQDWLEQLAIHEFRHVVQTDKISESLPQIIKLILGQQGMALVTGAYLPFWFLEGDAVVTETALSETGRGRFPSFLIETQAQVVEKGAYSFSKAYLGSYKDFVPDHYKLGYYLVGGARNYFGANIWEKTVSNVGKKPFSLTPFKSALKANTGMNQKQLYEFVFDSLKTSWINSDKSGHFSSGLEISKPAGVYTNYQYNFNVGTDSILTLKSSFNSLSKFILIDSEGNEKGIFTPGYIFDESVEFRGNKLVWSEHVPDIRWEHSGRSLIHILDIKTHIKQSFFSEFKGFSPAISPDETKISLVEVDFANIYYLSIYDLKSLTLADRFQLKDNLFLFTPKWLNNNELVLIVLDSNGKSLARVNISDGSMENLTDNSLGDIKHPVVKNNLIYFICSYSGKDDLYMLNLDKMSIFRIFSSRFGIEYPAISQSGNEIVISNYTSDGFRLISVKNEKEKQEPLSSVKKGDFQLAERMASQEPGVINFNNTDTTNYQSEKYSKFRNLIHFHSWLPAYFDVGSYDIKPGISFLSQNLLGTAETSFGYKYDISEKSGKVFGKFTYKGWYPMIDIEVTDGKRKSEYYSIIYYTDQNNQVIRIDTTTTEFNWTETTFDLGIRLPLTLSRGKYHRLIQPEVKFELTYRRNANDQPDYFTVGNITSASYRLYFHQILRKSYQDLVPDFGIVTDLFYQHSPGSDLELGNLMSAQMINYFPGIKRNHGLVIYNGVQKRKSAGGYAFSDNIRYPRGWSKYLNNFMYSFSASYKFPLICPDFSLGSLVYLKRIKASFYADYAYHEGDIYHMGEITGSFADSFSSYGLELTGDMHFLRFYAPVDMGFRIGYLPEVKQMDYGFLLSVDFTSF
ncbi:MAG: hypothetical protein JW833_10545 [Prolixibacteraceae bacterium]|nr:hypothetical protein [Prolixibacteraceae bacterium]